METQELRIMPAGSVVKKDTLLGSVQRALLITILEDSARRLNHHYVGSTEISKQLWSEFLQNAAKAAKYKKLKDKISTQDTTATTTTVTTGGAVKEDQKLPPQQQWQNHKGPQHNLQCQLPIQPLLKQV